MVPHNTRKNCINDLVFVLSNDHKQFPFVGISVIDQQPKPDQSGLKTSPVEEFRISCLNGEDFKEKLTPSDIKLSSAMAMSAAALSPYLGKYKEIEEKSTHILTLIGMEMAANLVYDMKNERNPEGCPAVRFYQ